MSMLFASMWVALLIADADRWGMERPPALPVLFTPAFTAADALDALSVRMRLAAPSQRRQFIAFTLLGNFGLTAIAVSMARNSPWRRSESDARCRAGSGSAPPGSRAAAGPACRT